MRACDGLTFEGCPGSSVETDGCNEVSCPNWSNWSSWGDCSATCDGGTQSRTRTCLSEEESDCAGSATDEQQCNQQSCGGKMVYWRNQKCDGRKRWTAIHPRYLPDGETMLDRCVSYCLGDSYCIGVNLTIRKNRVTGQLSSEICYLTYQKFSLPIKPVDGPVSSSGPIDVYNVLAVNEEYYKSNPHYFGRDIFPYPPENSIGGSGGGAEGFCGQTMTSFGMVNYKESVGIGFSAREDHYIFRENDTAQCAAKCFEKAGCSSFHVDDNGCTYVIGAPRHFESEDILNSGWLTGVCPSNAFRSSFTRVSQFYCLILSPDEAENLADSIVKQNTANSNTPLRVWTFETHTSTGSSMFASSQYVSVSMPDMKGSDKRYRPVSFMIETHIRIGETQSDRKRRSADREPELVFVKLTPELDDKLHKQAVREAKQYAKQRFIMPRTNDILAQIEEIEQQATRFILDGGIEFPDGVEVAATGPIETVEFVQTTADGSIAADCSTGTCQCSAGFIDNGSGCEEMTEEQAAPTKAPTTAPTTAATTTAGTQATTQSTPQSTTQTTTQSTTEQTTQTTTQEITSNPVSDWIQSLVNKMEAVFENDRPKKRRSQLLDKWQKIAEKFVKRYEKVASNDCNLDETYEDDSVDFSSVNTCRVSFSVT